MVAADLKIADFSTTVLLPLGSREGLGNPVCCELFDYCIRLQDGEEGWKFDLLEVPGAIPYIILLDVVDTTPRLKIRINGQQIVTTSGRDKTGNILEVGGHELPLTRLCCKAVLACEGPVSESREFSVEVDGVTRYFDETLAVPLFDKDQKVKQIVIALGPSYPKT